MLGQLTVEERPILDAVVVNAAWARRIVPRWAAFARSLGFSGIHWSTLGNFNGGADKGSDFPSFLRTALPFLERQVLGQTGSFVDGFGWDDGFLQGAGWTRNVIAFPYWEAKTVPFEEDKFYGSVAPAPAGGSVFVCFPGRSANHVGEEQNVHEKGVWPLDLLIKRWIKARCHGNTYLAIGDGYRHAQTEYLPDSSDISNPDIMKIRRAVFTAHCPDYRVHHHVAATPIKAPLSSTKADEAADHSPSTSPASPPALEVPKAPRAFIAARAVSSVQGHAPIPNDVSAIAKHQAAPSGIHVLDMFGGTWPALIGAFAACSVVVAFCFCRPRGAGPRRASDMSFNASPVKRRERERARNSGGTTW